MPPFTRTQIVGRGGRTQLVGQLPAGNAAAYGASDGGVRAVERQLREVREFPIGLETTGTVNAATAGQIQVQPQVIYRSERLAVVASLATFFDLNDLIIGKDSQLAVPGQAIPCEAIDNRSVGVRMSLDTAEPGILITVKFTNNDTVAHAFKGVLFGTVMQ